MSGTIQTERQGGLARVTLSHPGRFNAVTRTMWRQLRSVFEDFQRDQTLRCVLVRGEEGQFCAGGDISEYPDFRFTESGLRDFHENDVWGGLRAMLDCDVPIVAQIEGHCMGAGLEIACCCDIRIAGASSKFGAPIGRLGFPMAPREAALVRGQTGSLTVREMLLEAATFNAEQMHARGFLSRVVPDGAAAQEANESVSRIAAMGPRAARLNKRTLRALKRSDPPDGGLNEVSQENILARAYDYADSPEHREGIAAFLEKRKADF